MRLMVLLEKLIKMIYVLFKKKQMSQKSVSTYYKNLIFSPQFVLSLKGIRVKLKDLKKWA